MEIISILYTDPTISINDIAKRINRSSKGVRLALKRLKDTNSIRFTIQPHIHFYCIKISFQEIITGQELHQWIWKELPCVWEMFFSSTEVAIFVTFFIEHISDITHIRRWFTSRASCQLEVEAIGEPMRYYDSIRTEALRDMISKTQVS